MHGLSQLILGLFFCEGCFVLQVSKERRNEKRKGVGGEGGGGRADTLSHTMHLLYIYTKSIYISTILYTKIYICDENEK